MFLKFKLTFTPHLGINSFLWTIFTTHRRIFDHIYRLIALLSTLMTILVFFWASSIAFSGLFQTYFIPLFSICHSLTPYRAISPFFTNSFDFYHFYITQLLVWKARWELSQYSKLILVSKFKARKRSTASRFSLYSITHSNLVISIQVKRYFN